MGYKITFRSICRYSQTQSHIRGNSTGVTKGYTGDINYEQATAQVGRKAQGAGLGVIDPYGRGYRFEKDVYDTLSIYQAQRLSAIKSGIDPSAFLESDKAFADIMGRKITYGTEKGGATGQKTVTRSIGDIYKEYYEQATSGVKTSNHPQIENVPSTSPFTAGLSSPAISRLSVFGSNLPSSLQESSTINKILSVLSQSPSKSLLQSVYPSGSKSSSQAARSPYSSRSQLQSPSFPQLSSLYQSSSSSRSQCNLHHPLYCQVYFKVHPHQEASCNLRHPPHNQPHMIHSYLQYFHHPPHHRDQVRVTARIRHTCHHTPRIRHTRHHPPE